MGLKVKVGNQWLDQEWVQLMETARQMGMTTEEVRHFLQSSMNSPSLSEKPPVDTNNNS